MAIWATHISRCVWNRSALFTKKTVCLLEPSNTHRASLPIIRVVNNTYLCLSVTHSTYTCKDPSYNGDNQNEPTCTTANDRDQRNAEKHTFEKGATGLPNILNTNARSLEPKMCDLRSVCFTHNVDIAFITETWAKEYNQSESFKMKCYQSLRKDRKDPKKTRGGGVMVYIKETIPIKHCTEYDEQNFEVLWFTACLKSLQLPIPQKCLIMAAVYFPPDQKSKTDQNNMSEYLSKCIKDLDKTHPNSGLFLVGDFNSLKDTYVETCARGLKQIVTEPTRNDKILDKIYTTMADQYGDPYLLEPLGRSDHKIVISTAK